MRYARRALVAGGLGFVVSFIVACGGSGGLLSRDQAGTLNNRLNQVSLALSSGDCGAVSNATSGLSNAVADLPDSVNATLRANLTQGASTVESLATVHCQQTTTPTTPTTATSSTTTTSPHTTTETTPAATTPAPAVTTPATTPAGSGTTSTGSSGGAGLGAGGGGGTGGAGPGNGNQQ